jgi:hypothetical protein
MSHSSWLPRLKEVKLFTGFPDQVKDWSEILQVRAIGNMEGRVYYVAWKGTNKKVHGTQEYKEWQQARQDAFLNWKQYLDEEFEREFLNGSTGNQVDAETEG